MPIAIFVGLLAVSLAGCLLIARRTRRPTPSQTRTWQPPDDDRFPDLVNFGEVTPDLWRGAQPTAEGFRQLERAGIKTVVNLRSDHDDLPLLEGTGLKYLRIPMRAWNPFQGKDGQLALVLITLERLLADPACRPVFLHCGEGRDRTGYVLATWRRLVQGWDADDAIAEMFDYRFNRLWFRNPGYVRNVDLNRIRALMDLAPQCPRQL